MFSPIWSVAFVLAVYLVSEAYVRVHTHHADSDIKAEIEKLKTEINALKMKSTFG